MVSLRLVPPPDEEGGEQPVDQSADGQLDSSVVSDIYSEDKEKVFGNIRNARKALARALNQKAEKGMRRTEESNLKYVDPKRFGDRFERTLQDIFFTFREEITGVIYWIRFNRGMQDKGPSINWHINDMDWGEI